MQKGRMQEFFDNNAQEQHYSVSIIKCADIACQFHKPRRLPEAITEDLKFLPDPVLDQGATHYEPFNEVYDKHTTEIHNPSPKETSREAHQLPFNPCCQTAGPVSLPD